MLQLHPSLRAGQIPAGRWLHHPGAELLELPHDARVDHSGPSGAVRQVWSVSGEVLGTPHWSRRGAGPGSHAQRWTGAGFEPVSELAPSASPDGPGSWSTGGAATLGDGTEVFIWEGDGYERFAGQWTRTFPLRAVGELGNWTSAPATPDGFYYLHERRVRLARRDAEPAEPFPWATNVMAIAQGPEGSVLMQFGKNDRAWVLAVAFPDGSCVPIRRKDLGAVHANELFTGAVWSRATNLFYTAGWALVTLRADEVLAAKRSRPRS